MESATVRTEATSHQQSTIATVLEVSQGKAARVVIMGETTPVEVMAHATSVPWLEKDDQVLIVLTPQGLIVTHRLRRPQETPSVGFDIRDGVAHLDKVRAIQLKAGKSTLELNADGRIRLDGSEILSWAEHRITQCAATIEIN
ncbi:MAG: hypothetical protein P8103_01715 [Candidatus Thiodiazotropha sp.]